MNGGVRRTWLIARRELRERLGQKAYRYGLVIGAVLAAAAVLVPSALQGDDDGPGSGEIVPVTVAASAGVAADRVSELSEHSKTLLGPGGPRFRTFTNAKAVREAVRDGDHPLGVTIAGSADRPALGLVVREDGGGDLASQVAQVLDRDALVRRLGTISSEAADAAAQPVAIAPDVVEGAGPDDSTAAVVSVLSLILYIGGLMLMTAYASGLISDRANRVTERLLTAARPAEHLTGKLIGVGAAGALQLVVWIAGALVATTIVSGSGATSPLADLELGALLYFPVAFVTTYVLYAALATVLVLPVRKTEDVGAATATASMLQVVAFILASMIIAPGSTVSSGIAIASLVPFFSPLLMLARLAGGDVAAWEVAIAIAGPLLLAALLLRLVAPAYARHAIDAPDGKGVAAALRALRS